VLESRGGHVAQTVIDFAEEKDVDAIVVGKRGAGAVTDMLLGSVPQKLVNLSNRVIMVVP
jgi:nucleotide-binding universal stress UspA family protein